MSVLTTNYLALNLREKLLEVLRLTSLNNETLPFPWRYRGEEYSQFDCRYSYIIFKDGI